MASLLEALTKLNDGFEDGLNSDVQNETEDSN
jgi:hypothetical protein